MTLEAGWLKRQMDRVDDDINQWPEWMKREAGILQESAVRDPQFCDQGTTVQRLEPVEIVLTAKG